MNDPVLLEAMEGVKINSVLSSSDLLNEAVL